MPKISAPTLGEHRVETTDRILDAWGDLIRDKGYSDVSLTDVAARAGLVRTALYNYFQDRESLLLAWTEREVSRTVEELQRTVDGDAPSVDKLRESVRLQLIAFTAAHLPPGREVAHFLGQETYTRFMQHVDPIETAVRQIIAEGIKRGEFADIPPQSVVPLIQGCIGAERVPLATGEHDLEEATDRVTNFLLRALGAAAPDNSNNKAKGTRRIRRPARG
jgi:AcrR family transcriptional regulator